LSFGELHDFLCTERGLHYDADVLAVTGLICEGFAVSCVLSITMILQRWNFDGAPK
jgi:hypothetical protein